MKKLHNIRLFLIRLLLISPEKKEIADMVNKLYDDVWPKHKHYEAQTRKQYELALIKAKFRS